MELLFEHILKSVAYLGFHEEGGDKFLLATSAYTKGEPCFPFLLWQKAKIKFATGGISPPNKLIYLYIYVMIFGPPSGNSHTHRQRG